MEQLSKNEIMIMEVTEFDFLKGNVGKNGEITPFFIKKVELLNVINDNGDFLQSLNLLLTKDFFDHNFQVSVDFFNINIIGILNFNLTQLIGLQINNISDRQMEDCNFHVYDCENEYYDFYCEKIFIRES